MQNLLNLLAGVSLLVWGTHNVRTGVLRIYGGDLRRILRHSVSNRFTALFAGLGVTSLIQSSTATALIVAAFAGQGLIATAPALAVMLGADVGTSLMVLVFSFDLSWLSPLLIFVGVVLFLSRQETNVGRFGLILIGLGLIILALQWIMLAAKPVTQAAGVKVIFASLAGDVLLDMLFAALLTLLAYSSLAVALLTAALAASNVIGIHVALGLVLGATLGSGLLAMLSTARAPPEARRVTLGNFLFKLIGCAVVVPLLGLIEPWLAHLGSETRQVVLFHLLFNVAIAVVFLFLTEPIARIAERMMPARPASEDPAKPRHLDPSALATPALAISCAAREALRIGDIIERIIIDVEDKKIDKGRKFSDAGMAEICDLHARIISNLRLGLSVFLNGDLKSAQELLAQKVLLRELERAYADSRLERLAGNTLESIETSSLHLDLISDLKRINSHIASIAYPILEQAGVLARTRLKDPAAERAPRGRRGGGRNGGGGADAGDGKDDWRKRKPHTA